MAWVICPYCSVEDNKLHVKHKPPKPKLPGFKKFWKEIEDELIFKEPLCDDVTIGMCAGVIKDTLFKIFRDFFKVSKNKEEKN